MEALLNGSELIQVAHARHCLLSGLARPRGGKPINEEQNERRLD
jgi:hypothetical protein